jgi:hypothetical protein
MGTLVVPISFCAAKLAKQILYTRAAQRHRPWAALQPNLLGYHVRMACRSHRFMPMRF